MRSRSARGSSTPTSRPTKSAVRLVLAAVLLPIATAYVIAAFIAPNPMVRIVLRSLPVLPLGIWTLWYEPSRPFERQPPMIRVAGRILVAVLGIGLNWLYDPERVI